MAHLLYGVGAGGGFILLTGEVGTGKTTINRCLLEQLPQNTDIAIILNPALNAMELLASACDEFGIDYDPDKHTLKTLTDQLHKYLLENHNRGRKTVLLIDEAQHLDFDVLEQIRLLTNLETNSEKLLQIILIGQPELSQMLARPELRQLNQRITARYNLEPLNLNETSAYIQHRLQVAGMSPEREIFPAGVVRGIHKKTRGIPRLINVLCDRILLGAYGRNTTRADNAMLKIAVREVLGEPIAKSRSWTRVALVSAAVLVGAGSWWWLGNEAGQQSIQSVQLPMSVEAIGVDSGAAEETVLVPEYRVEIPQAQVPQPQTDIALPETDVLSAALLPPGSAMSKLWLAYGARDAPAVQCPRAQHDGIACLQAEALTWDELADFDRPLVLDMVTPDRFSAQVLLLGFQGDLAWVLAGDVVRQISLIELAPGWTGGYRFLWHPPAGFEHALALEDDSPVVAQLALLFARLDGREQPLSGQRFSSELQMRVRLFQQQFGLADDGVVGVQTILKLNEQLGIDATAEDLRNLFAENTESHVINE